MILLEVHDGLFSDPFRIRPHGNPRGWRVLTPCDGQPKAADEESVIAACPLLREGFGADTRHVEAFSALLTAITARAPAGGNLNDQFNAKQLHHVGEIIERRANGSVNPVTVWQFEKERTLVRALWLYGKHRSTLVITNMFVKAGGKTKTPRVEVDRAGTIFNGYAAAVHAGTARFIELQGGYDEFQRLQG